MEDYTQKYMFNTKLVLREELTTISKKRLLSESSLELIKNDFYVTTVLGIDKTLYENDLSKYRKLVVEQQIIIETMIDSINNYLGSAVQKGKEKSLQFIKSVKDLKELAILFKDILLDPKLMDEAIQNVKNSLNKEIGEFKRLTTKIMSTLNLNVEGIVGKFKAFFDNVFKYSNEFLANKGWVGFLSALGLTVLVTWVNRKWLKKISEEGLDMLVAEIKNLDSVINIFNGLKDLVKNAINEMGAEKILDWFVTFGSGYQLVGVTFAAAEIITIISEILIPTVQTITKRFNLSKAG